MKIEDIRAIKVADCEKGSVKLLLDQEIKDTSVSFIGLSEGESMIASPSLKAIKIFILCSGDAAFSSVAMNEPGVYVASPSEPIEISTQAGCEILLLERFILEEEMKEVLNASSLFPHHILFSEAPTYKEDCKSEKTTSRMIVPARIIPRFAMGSVETSGDDLVAKHTHPMLEQYFFGLIGNDCSLLIDNLEYPFEENHLVHIPLGSDHGVKSVGNQIIRYLWLDFLFDEKSLEYMDSAHKMDE